MPSSPSGPPHAAQVDSWGIRDDIATDRVRISTSRRCTSSHDRRALSGGVPGWVIPLFKCAHLVRPENLWTRDDVRVRRLLTIPISHFCEKARWALDRAGLDYVEERHVQGVHRVVARRAGGGATVPVLVTAHGVLPDS